MCTSTSTHMNGNLVLFFPSSNGEGFIKCICGRRAGGRADGGHGIAGGGSGDNGGGGGDAGVQGLPHVLQLEVRPRHTLLGVLGELVCMQGPVWLGAGLHGDLQVHGPRAVHGPLQTLM
ncbi:hypothetical protein VPH35_102227 [Triticum aestivum]